MSTLKTDYKNDVLDTTKNTARKYLVTSNADGTVSYEDKTVYTQEGDSFGAGDINATNAEVNALNQSLTNISVYVGSDKKLHFVDKDGADSVLPFSSGLSEYACGTMSVSVSTSLQTFSISYGKTFSKTPTVLVTQPPGQGIAAFIPNGQPGVSSCNIYSRGWGSFTTQVNWFAYVPQS